MKKVLVVLLLLVICAATTCGEELSISAGIGWMAELRAGGEYLFLPRLGLQAHVGASIASAMTADAFLVWRMSNAPGRASVRLLIGVPNALLPFGVNELMVSLGAAVEGRLWLSRRVGLSVRMGEGYPLFYENGAFVSKSLRYPLGLWPDFFVFVWLRL